MSLFKKKDEDIAKSYKPTSNDVSEKSGAGGKGGGEPAQPSYDPSKKADARKIQKSLNDRRYGYIDENTGIEVPWYIDMINGGGMNSAGDKFEGGGMYSRIANAANVAPYGYNQPRRYAQVGMQGYPTAAPAPTGGGVGGGSSTVTPPPATGVLPTAVNEPIEPSYSMPTQIGNSGSGMMGAPSAPRQYPTDSVNILDMGGTNLMNTQVLGTGRSVNTFGEQALRDKAIQLYGQAFNDLTPSSQRLIIQGLMQGMANAN